MIIAYYPPAYRDPRHIFVCEFNDAEYAEVETWSEQHSAIARRLPAPSPRHFTRVTMKLEGSALLFKLTWGGR